ncbi:hypothetical protein RvY_02068 [Ramazzottius varieornatus]|uniref:Uncharacterized protein n=1 Tax=Ramazzottius varieornatus TaxID=947166 RepID=A0A1D1UM84_RAMVA|nr:hypothetical protein RvY_02068 [Ramazzottius varieornatus]
MVLLGTAPLPRYLWGRKALWPAHWFVQGPQIDRRLVCSELPAMTMADDSYSEKLRRWRERVPPPLRLQPSAPELTLSFGGDISSIAPESPRENFPPQAMEHRQLKFAFVNEETMSADAYSERRKASTPVSPRGIVNEGSIYLDCESSHYSLATSSKEKVGFFADDYDKTITPVFSDREGRLPEDHPVEFCSPQYFSYPEEISSPVIGMVRIDDLRTAMFAQSSWKEAIGAALSWMFSTEELLHCAANKDAAAAQFEDVCLNQTKLEVIYQLTKEYCYCFGGDRWREARGQSWRQRTTDVLRVAFDDVVTRNQTHLRKDLGLAPLTLGEPCKCEIYL